MAQKVNMTQYVQALAKINSKVIPGAVREALNGTAFDVRKQGIKNIERNLTIRNRWTVNSVRVDKARGRNIQTMEARTGSILDYMRLQEHGGTVRAKASKLAIPTDKSRISESRTRKISTRYKINRLGRLGAKGTKAFAANFRKKGIYIRKGKRLIMLRNLEHQSVQLKPTHWLSEATFKEATERNLNRRFQYFAERALTRG